MEGGGGRVRGKLRTADARIPRRYWQEEAAQYAMVQQKNAASGVKFLGAAFFL